MKKLSDLRREVFKGMQRRCSMECHSRMKPVLRLCPNVVLHALAPGAVGEAGGNHGMHFASGTAASDDEQEHAPPSRRWYHAAYTRLLRFWAPPQPVGAFGVRPQPDLQDLLPRQRELLPHRPLRQRRARPCQPQGRAPSLVQGHVVQHQGEGRGGHAGVRARQQGHRPRHQALPRPVQPCEAGAVLLGVQGRVGAVDGEQGRRQGLSLHPHGQQHPPQLRRLPQRQGPRRRARRHHHRALGVVQGREPELEDPVGVSFFSRAWGSRFEREGRERN